MDIQKLVEAMNEQAAQARSNYHLTLGELIEELENDNPRNSLVFSDDYSYVGDEDSYRGYYCDLAFDSVRSKKTVAEVLKQTKKALKATYDGYEGGEFVMEETTSLWKSSYGNASDLAIVGYHKGTEGISMLLIKRV